MIKVVSFDIGGTLIHRDKNKSLVDEISLGTGIDREIINDKFRGFFVNQSYGVKDFCEDIGCERPLMIIELIETWKQKPKSTLFNDVNSTLIKLRERYHLVSISNMVYWNRIRLADYGLRSLFDLEVYSFNIGVAKPKSEIFRYVEDKLKVSPGEIVHIGDSITSDVLGANIAGWSSVLICRNDVKIVNEYDCYKIPDHTIKTLDVIPFVIDDINQTS